MSIPIVSTTRLLLEQTVLLINLKKACSIRWWQRPKRNKNLASMALHVPISMASLIILVWIVQHSMQEIVIWNGLVHAMEILTILFKCQDLSHNTEFYWLASVWRNIKWSSTAAIGMMWSHIMTQSKEFEVSIFRNLIFSNYDLIKSSLVHWRSTFRLFSTLQWNSIFDC